MPILNVRVGHEMRPAGDRYLTPRWCVEFLLQWWHPLPGTLLVDPAAGGWGGWTIGGQIAEACPVSALQLRDEHATLGSVLTYPRPVALLDIAPMHPSVHRADYLETDTAGPLSLATNPPYSDLLEAFLAKALVDATPAGEVLFLAPYLWLTAVGGERTKGLTHIWQPRRRVQFELVPEDAEARLRWNAEHPEGPKFPAKRSAESSTGWTVGSPGGAHCWARWVPGYEGRTEIVLANASTA